MLLRGRSKDILGTLWGLLLGIPKFRYTFLSILLTYSIDTTYLNTIQNWETYLELSWISMRQVFTELFNGFEPWTIFFENVPSQKFNWVLNIPQYYLVILFCVLMGRKQTAGFHTWYITHTSFIYSRWRMDWQQIIYNKIKCITLNTRKFVAYECTYIYIYRERERERERER